MIKSESKILTIRIFSGYSPGSVRRLPGTIRILYHITKVRCQVDLSNLRVNGKESDLTPTVESSDPATRSYDILTKIH